MIQATLNGEVVEIGDYCEYGDCKQFILSQMEDMDSLQKIADCYGFNDVPELLNFLITDGDDEEYYRDIVFTDYFGVEKNE